VVPFLPFPRSTEGSVAGVLSTFWSSFAAAMPGLDSDIHSLEFVLYGMWVTEY